LRLCASAGILHLGSDAIRSGASGAAGEVLPVIDRSYPLRETPEAFRYLEEEHARGKVVITQWPEKPLGGRKRQRGFQGSGRFLRPPGLFRGVSPYPSTQFRS
jgi:hypothetical protein